MRSWKHKPLPALVLVTALLALLLLATLQYHWVAQVSSGERERMQAHLRVGATRFSDDFDRELARAYLSFQIDAATVADRAWDRYAQRYHRWFAAAPYPRLVDQVFLVEVSQRGRLRLSHFDPTTNRFKAGPWPDSLASLRQDFERAYPPGRLRTGSISDEVLEPVADEIPALVIPASRVWILSNRQDVDIAADLLYSEGVDSRPFRLCLACRLRPGDDMLFAHTIVTLNQQYLKEELIPALARQHLATGAGLDYNLAIASRSSPGSVIYRSNPQMPAGALTSGDASVNLFSLRFDELNRLLLSEALGPEEAPGGDIAASERITIGILGSTPSTGTAPSASPAGTNDGKWQLTLTHRAGSLEAAVASLRLRNLIISFSIVLVLAVALAMMVVSTQRAQRLAAQKLEFAAAISHELHTPLAVICSAGENLADGIIQDPEQARRYGVLIRGESRRLATMVEQALEFAGVQSGRKTYDLRQVEVNDLIESALAGCQVQLGEGHFVIEQEIQPDLPPVLGDAAALRRAIQNLVSNAIKYGGERRWIGLRAQRVVGDRGVEVQIAVRDSGLGIRPADLPHIFEPFYRGREAMAAQIHGSGLGLSLVQHIVAAHKGHVRVESVPGQGSTFTLHLPAIMPEEGVRGEPTEGTYGQAYSAS